MKEVFAVLALCISVAANIPYIFEIVKGKVRPERISWLLWTMLGATYYVSAIKDGGATLFTFGELIGPVTIFVLSLKFGVGGKSRFDLASLTVALIAFGLLFVTNGTLTSLLLALFIDFIGVVLTVRKLLLDPASESKVFWGMAGISSIFALLSLQNITLETVLFPAYVLVISSFIFIKANPRHEEHLEEITKL